jgi:DnaJ-class molecular chaperone
MSKGKTITCPFCYGSGYALAPDNFGEHVMTNDKCQDCDGCGEILNKYNGVKNESRDGK